ncbi:MAG TPA: hypothetical protein VG755_34730 [Nannocystaceae bacterium]|nr:hypothetical protein [Nannocystaceae bacterium]
MSAVPAESFFPAFLRAFWMLLGNAVLLVLALTIARLPPWTLGWHDLLFAGSVVALLWSRWVDAVRYGGTTAQGEPVTRPILLRWAAIVVAASAMLWLLVQSIGV